MQLIYSLILFILPMILSILCIFRQRKLYMCASLGRQEIPRVVQLPDTVRKGRMLRGEYGCLTRPLDAGPSQLRILPPVPSHLPQAHLLPPS